MYKRILKWLILSLFLISITEGAVSQSIIVLASSSDKELLQKAKRDLNEYIKSEHLLSQERLKVMNPRVVSTGDNYLLVLGPVESDMKLASDYFNLKKRFPAANIINSPQGITATTTQSKTVVKPEHKSSMPTILNDYIGDEDNTVWFALFALAFIAVLSLYISSIKTRRIIEDYERMRKKQEEMEKKQHELFTELGENIYSMSRDVVKNTKHAISESNVTELSDELKEVVRTENRILDTTNNLLGFLKIKARKVEIEYKPFNLNSLLDEVVGSLMGRFRNHPIELVFDVDRNLPKYVVADFVHIAEILRNLLDYEMSHTRNGEVVLEAYAQKNFADATELRIRIYNNGNIVSEEITEDECFIPKFDKENGEYKRLELFVAYELIKLMGGDISIELPGDGSCLFDIAIPIRESEKEERRKYRLPHKSLTQKSVYIVNKSMSASLALEKMFAYFKHKVTVDTYERFKAVRPDLGSFDIILIDEIIMDDSIAQMLSKLRQSRDVKIVGLYRVFDPEVRVKWENVFDKRVAKPLNQERVFILIKQLYHALFPEVKNEEYEIDTNREFIEKVEETPNVNLESFQDFSGGRLLVVEDNEVNTKVLLKLLQYSQMEITTASNGQEAVDIVKERGPSSFDLILMDINMPVMDGYTATENIREIDGATTLPIVALTALVLENEIQKMRSCGMNAYLPKPINVGRLYTVFATFIGKRVSSTEETPRFEIASIDGIDIREGLEHSNNNPLLYREILSEFLDVYSQSGELMKKLQKEQRYVQLKQLSLDIMGLAGSIGADKLQKLANEIYKLFLYNKTDLLPKFIEEYNTELNRVIEGIKKYLDTRE